MAASDASASFAIDLEVKGTAEAQAGAEALEQLRNAIQGDVVALRQMQAAMRQLQGGGVQNTEVMRRLKDQIAAQKAKIAQAQNAYLQLGGTFGQQKRPAAEAAGLLTRLGDAAQGMPGPLGAAAGRLGQLGSLLGRGGPIVAGALAVVAVMALVVGAVGAAIAALGRYALAQADARRSELLRLEGMTKVRRFMLGGFGPRTSDSGSFLQSTIDSVSSSVAASRDEVASLAGELYRAGLRGGNLQEALEGASIALSAGGQEAVQQFKAMALGAGLMGGSVKKVADDARARFGKINDAMRLGLNVQIAKAREGFNRMFRDLNIEPLLRGMKVLTDMFDDQTIAGRTLKTLMETMIQPVINAAEKAGPLIAKFFQGMRIAALVTTLILIRLQRQLKTTFGGADVVGDIDLVKTAVMGGIAVFSALAFTVGLAAAAFGLLGAAVGAVGLTLTAPFLLIAKGVELVRAINWTKLGQDVVKGIADGIRAGVQWVLDAMRSLGFEAHKEFKRATLSRSPSQLFRRTTRETIPTGIAVGLREGRPMVMAATRALVSVPREQMRLDAAAGVSAAAAPASRGNITIENVSIQVGSGQDVGPDFVTQVRVGLIAALQGVREELAAVPNG